MKRFTVLKLIYFKVRKGRSHFDGLKLAVECVNGIKACGDSSNGCRCGNRRALLQDIAVDSGGSFR